MAFEPNWSRTVSSVASSDDPSQPSNGNASCIRTVVLEVGEADADQRDALTPTHRQGGNKQGSLGREQRRGIGRGLGGSCANASLA